MRIRVPKSDAGYHEPTGIEKVTTMTPLPALLLLGPLLLGAAEKERRPVAPPVPTGQEIIALGLLDGYRADSGSGQVPLVHLMKIKALPINPQAWARGIGNSPKPKPATPLVINPLLMSAARTILDSGIGPVDKQPMAFAEPFHTIGYAPDATGQVLIARNAVSLRVAFAAALTQVVGEREQKPHNMIPIFAAIEACSPAWREAGIAVATGKDGTCSLVMVLGAGSAKRHVGGVAYTDANRNGRYDAGEGQAGVQVAIGTATMTTGPGGAWWLALADEQPADISFAHGDQRAVRPLAQGADTQTIDWRIPTAADLKLADRLIAEAEKSPPANPAKQRQALSALLSGTRLAVLDDARQSKIATLTQPIQAEFDDLLRQAMAALSEDAPVFKKRMAALKKSWDGCVPKLFKEFDGLYALRQQVTDVLAAPEERQVVMAPPVIKQVEAASAESTDPLCLGQLDTWRESLSEALPPQVSRH
jgi:hypothetical protein